LITADLILICPDESFISVIARSWHSFRLAAAALLLGNAGSAWAADLTAPAVSAVPTLASGWIVTVTGNAKIGPSYPGADDLSFIAFPSFNLRRPGEPKRFTTPDDGLSLPFYDTQALRLGVTGRFKGGRYLESDRRLFGFEDVKWAVEPGLFVEFWPADFLRLRAELRRGLNGHDGFVADLGGDFVSRFDRFTLSIGPRLSLGDEEFVETYFGVRPFEAALNGLVTPYSPSGGVTSVGASSSLSYDWSEQWSTTVSASYAHLVGDAADSPIVKRFGSEHQFSLGASVSYSFSTGGW
jgi:outer membrane scaffolding protein for murein synthesis (MipA/OmpV family)